MEQRTDIRRINEGQMADEEKTADVFVIELIAQRNAYREAEEEFQKQLRLLLSGASYVATITRIRAARSKEGA